MIFDTAAKIDLTRIISARGQADYEGLLGLQWSQKLDCRDRSKLTIFVHGTQCCENFIEDQHPGYERLTRKMSGQTGVISTNRAPYFKGHISEVFLTPAAPASQPK
jgi:hypothetical protein